MNSLAPYSNHFEQRSMPSDGQRDFNVLRWLVPGAAMGSGTAGHSQIGVIGKEDTYLGVASSRVHAGENQ